MKAAIKELMDEHDVILRMLAVLRAVCARIRKHEAVAVEDLEAALDFIKTFADYNHHAKEEDLLFPAMEKAGFPRQAGPIAVMLMEHEEGRSLVKKLGDSVSAVKKGAGRALAETDQAASGYEILLTHHIFKENNVLYPMAMRALPEPVWDSLQKEFAVVEAERMGQLKRQQYVELIARLEKTYCAGVSAAAS